MGFERKPNRVEVRGDVTVIYIRRGGKEIECLIDTPDLPLVQQYTWSVNTSGYAQNWTHGVLMHVLIMHPPTGMVCDHIHHNTLDNRRSQLRVVPETVNHHNRRIAPNNVHWHGQSKKWRVRFLVNWRHISFGLYANRADADAVADVVREKLRNGEAIESIEASVRAARPAWKLPGKKYPGHYAA